MATIQRPTKEGSVRTYQEKVGLGFVDILASEMDADLDTIYAAWNGGVDSVTLKDGSVTTPKIVDGNVTGAKIVPSPTIAGTLSLPGGGTNNLLEFGPRTAKGRLVGHPSTDVAYFTFNAGLNPAASAWVQDGTGGPSWLYSLGGTGVDSVSLARIPAGSASPATLLTLDGTGTLVVPGLARHKTYSSGINGATNWPVGSGASGGIAFENVWFNSGGQTAPNPGAGYIYTPGTGGLMLLYGQINFSPNGGLGVGLTLQYSDTGTTWNNYGVVATTSQTSLVIVGVFPAPANYLWRLLITNASGATTTVTFRYLVGICFGSW